jgi:hypothetical protein
MRRRVFKLLAALFLIIAGVGATAAVADATGLINVTGDDGGSVPDNGTDAVGWD